MAIFSIPSIELTDKIEPGKVALEYLRDAYRERFEAEKRCMDECEWPRLVAKLQWEYDAESRPIIDAMVSVSMGYLPTLVMTGDDRNRAPIPTVST